MRTSQSMPKKQKTLSTLIIDIGTASVGAALVSEGSTSIPLLAQVRRIPIGTGSESSRQALLQTAESALKTLLDAYAATPVRNVKAVVAAPWHEARIRTLVSKTERLAPVTKKTLTRAVTRYQDEKPPKSGNVDVEAVALHVQVNGYGTGLARQVMGTRLDINLYESEMSGDIQKRFWSRIESAFPNADISFHTFPLVALIALRSLLAETSFMAIDIAGEMTELSVMHNDTLRHLASFPIGYHTLARELSDDPQAIGDAMSRLTLWARDELDGAPAATLGEAFSRAFSKWQTAFDEVLRAASEHSPIPYPLYMISEKAPLSWFRKGLFEHNTFGVNPVPVDSALLQMHLQIAEGGLYDVFLGLAALFFHTQKTELVGEERGNAVIYSQ